MRLINVGACHVCEEPLFVAPGQIIRFHKQCRKEGRQRFGRATHLIRVEDQNKI